MFGITLLRVVTFYLLVAFLKKIMLDLEIFKGEKIKKLKPNFYVMTLTQFSPLTFF